MSLWTPAEQTRQWRSPHWKAWKKVIDFFTSPFMLCYIKPLNKLDTLVVVFTVVWQNKFAVFPLPSSFFFFICLFVSTTTTYNYYYYYHCTLQYVQSLPQMECFTVISFISILFLKAWSKNASSRPGNWHFYYSVPFWNTYSCLDALPRGTVAWFEK